MGEEMKHGIYVIQTPSGPSVIKFTPSGEVAKSSQDPMGERNWIELFGRIIDQDDDVYKRIMSMNPKLLYSFEDSWWKKTKDWMKGKLYDYSK